MATAAGVAKAIGRISCGIDRRVRYVWDIDTTLHSITTETRFFIEPAHPATASTRRCAPTSSRGSASAEAARRFGYQPGSFRVLCWRFRHHMDRDFFRASPHGPRTQPRKDAVRDRIIALRKQNLSVYDIRDELERTGPARLSVTAIQEVLRAEGFARLPRRADEERPDRPRPLADAIADVRALLPGPRVFSTRVGGLFLLLPLLARLDLDTVVAPEQVPGHDG